MVFVGLFDVHLDPMLDEFHPAYLAARNFILDIKPDGIVLGGDWGSFDSLGNWNKNKPLIAEGKRYEDDREVCLDELYFLKNKLHNTEFHWLTGNHEQRARWYVEKNPEMEGFIDINRDLMLYDLCETVTEYNDIMTIGELSWAHGFFYNVYHSAKTLHEFGDNIVYGHVHNFQSASKNQHFSRKEYISQSIGCLTDRYPEWKSNSPTRFQNGFVVVEYRHNGQFTMHPIIIINGHFMYGGYEWSA